jgi:hypothetical protein
VVKTFLLFLVPAALLAASPFAWREAPGGQWQLTENGRAVLTYNAGMQHEPKAPADRARCCYIYPAYTPGGVNPLDDFPADHWHHRGLHWAWSFVEIEGRRHDNWMFRTLRHQAESPVNTNADAGQATLKVSNLWVNNAGKAFVREHVTLTAYPARGSAREMDFELTMEALDTPVILRGDPVKGKSYGGFNARFAPRTGTVIRTNQGVLEKKNDDLTHYEWAEMEAVYDGRRAALRITSDAKNPLAPHQWVLRDYGYVGASFPGRTETIDGYTLEKGKPVTLRFRVRLADVDENK